MGLRHKLIESTNRGFPDPGQDRPVGLRHAIEDRLIQVLEDAVMDQPKGFRVVRLEGFREWLKRYSLEAEWNQDNAFLCFADDNACEHTILFTICKLKRMMARQEWAANILLQRGLPIEMLPSGQEYLGC